MKIDEKLAKLEILDIVYSMKKMQYYSPDTSIDLSQQIT